MNKRESAKFMGRAFSECEAAENHAKVCGCVIKREEVMTVVEALKNLKVCCMLHHDEKMAAISKWEESQK